MKAQTRLTRDIEEEMSQLLGMIKDDKFFKRLDKDDRHYLCDSLLLYQLRYKQLTGKFYSPSINYTR